MPENVKNLRNGFREQAYDLKSGFFYLQVKAKLLNSFLQGDKADDGKTGVVNVVLIVILTAVIVLMFFTGVYLYYMRGGKQYAKEFKDR